MMLDVINALLCLGIAWSCVCRLAAGHRGVLWAVRAHASIGLGAALVSGCAPLFDVPATWGQVMLAATIAIGMLASTRRWAGGIESQLIKDETP